MLTFNDMVYSYNANGEHTQTTYADTTTESYVFDSMGKLQSATLRDGKVITFKNDGRNRQVVSLLNGSLQSKYIYEDDYKIAAQICDAGLFAIEYIYGSSINSPDYFIKNKKNYKVIKDHLGSPRLIVNSYDGTAAQRIDYNDLGKVIADSAPGFQDYGFAGGIYDPKLKLVKFGARYYDPGVGRWASKDPILFDGGDTNLMGYVANDPINKIDPTGLYEVCTTPLSGFGSEFGPLYHQYLCANGVCGGQTRTGNPFNSPGANSNDGAPGSSGSTCKEGPKDNQKCMDQCIAGAIGGSRPNYSVINVGGSNCQKWANDTINNCAAQCGK